MNNEIAKLKSENDKLKEENERLMFLLKVKDKQLEELKRWKALHFQERM